MVTQLPWQLELNINNSFVLSCIEVTFDMKVPRDDKHQPYVPYCYGYLVAMATKIFLNNSFILSPVGFIFDMEVPQDDKHQPHTCYFGNSVVLAARVNPGNKQHTGLLSA